MALLPPSLDERVDLAVEVGRPLANIGLVADAGGAVVHPDRRAVDVRPLVAQRVRHAHPVRPRDVAQKLVLDGQRGLGDQVGYDKLVQHYKQLQIDKSSRFTNWSQRPLSERQINYALDDVIHLAEIYPRIVADLTANGRDKWVVSELAGLADIQLYQTDPDTAYKRIKARNSKPSQVNRLAQLASWREREAQKRDVPRGRILRDDTLIDLAGSNPKTLADLKKIRGFPGGENGKFGPFVIDVLKTADAMPEEEWPLRERPQQRERPPGAVIEMLRVLLKHVTESHNVAPRLIASADELEKLALSDTADIPAMQGWRREIFGDAALALKAGKLALTVKKGKTKLLSLES